MSDHYNKQNFFLDEDDLRDYEEYKKSHGAAERSREKLPYIKDGEETRSGSLPGRKQQEAAGPQAPDRLPAPGREDAPQRRKAPAGQGPPQSLSPQSEGGGAAIPSGISFWSSSWSWHWGSEQALPFSFLPERIFPLPSTPART